MRTHIERPPYEYRWFGDRYRRVARSGFQTVVEVPGIGTVKGPVVRTRRIAQMTASLIRKAVTA